MKTVFAALCVVVGLLTGSEAAWGKDDVKINVPTTHDARLQQVVPLLVGASSAVLGATLLAKPEKANELLEGIEVLNKEDKVRAQRFSGVQIAKGLVLLAVTLKGDAHSVRVANSLTLTTAVLEEGMAQYAARDNKYRSLTKRSQQIFTAVRAGVSLATLLALYSLRNAHSSETVTVWSSSGLRRQFDSVLHKAERDMRKPDGPDDIDRL